MLGQRLKELRLSRQKTQQDIADVLNISRSAYALYESGKRQLNYDSLCALADYFSVSLDYLFERTQSREWPGALSGDEIKLLAQYRALDGRGRASVRGAAELQQKLKNT